jgi:endonuclease-3
MQSVSLTSDKEPISRLLYLLDRHYPNAQCTLNFHNAYQLLIATILAAQCTDVLVNKITPPLFQKFPTPLSMVNASLLEIEEAIHQAGFFHTNARNIQKCCQRLVSEYGGNVPGEREDLLSLAGVGRKTANVILGVVFQTPAVVVDTHVTRISQRLGLTREKQPRKIEDDLMRLLPQTHWIKFGHQIIAHGRKLCLARSPKCTICPLAKICEFYPSTLLPQWPYPQAD